MFDAHDRELIIITPDVTWTISTAMCDTPDSTPYATRLFDHCSGQPRCKHRFTSTAVLVDCRPPSVHSCANRLSSIAMQHSGTIRQRASAYLETTSLVRVGGRWWVLRCRPSRPVMASPHFRSDRGWQATHSQCHGPPHFVVAQTGNLSRAVKSPESSISAALSWSSVDCLAPAVRPVAYRSIYRGGARA